MEEGRDERLQDLPRRLVGGAGSPRYARRKDGNQDAIVEYLEQCDGVFVFPLQHPVDLLVEIDGEIFLWEVKSARGSYTEAQLRFRERGFSYATITTPYEAACEVDRVRARHHLY